MIGNPSHGAHPPLGVFNFEVRFVRDPVDGQAADSSETISLCQGAFSEISGLEASMEPHTITEGGHNWGTHQRAGRVTFATVVLKRGVTRARDLWWWFQLLGGQGQYAARLRADIDMLDGEGQRVMGWSLRGAMPVKFKAADLNARSTDVGVEELHIVHEGLEHSA